MGQIDIIEVLEKSKKPISRSEIAKILNQDVVRVSHAIARLVKYNDIKVIEIDRNQAMKIYHCKRRMHIYYI